MVRKGVLATAALSIFATANAGSLEELKNLLGQSDAEINLAVTGNYLFTADRQDELNATGGYEDRFGYNAFIGVSKTASDQSPFGFALWVSNGAWAPTVGIEPLPSSSNSFTVDLAYAELKRGALYLQAGRLLTNIGGEAPYTWQNVNIQRGLVWYGEPVFYNGVRIGGDLGTFAFYAGVNDRDTGDGKMALEAGISTTLKNTSVSLNLLVPDKRDEWNTKTINLTVGTELAGIPVTVYADYLSTPQPGDDADSVGVAALAELPVNEQLSVGARVEYVNNDGDGDNYGIGVGNNAWTFTLTPKYQVSQYLYLRAEASYVKLGNDYYQKDVTDSEVRLGAEVGFVF